MSNLLSDEVVESSELVWYDRSIESSQKVDWCDFRVNMSNHWIKHDNAQRCNQRIDMHKSVDYFGLTQFLGNYLISTGSKTRNRIDLNPNPAEKLQRLVDSISKEYQWSSDMIARYESLEYSYIIGMGEKALSPILEGLTHENVDFWQWALHVITQHSPLTNNEMTAPELCESWIAWGQQNGLLD